MSGFIAVLKMRKPGSVSRGIQTRTPGLYKQGVCYAEHLGFKWFCCSACTEKSKWMKLLMEGLVLAGLQNPLKQQSQDSDNILACFAVVKVTLYIILCIYFSICVQSPQWLGMLSSYASQTRPFLFGCTFKLSGMSASTRKDGWQRSLWSQLGLWCLFFCCSHRAQKDESLFIST